MQHFHATDGARLAFRDEGQGQPLLALAGLTRDGRDFDYLAHHLSGVRLIRLDSRGRGGSDWTGADSYTVPVEAADVLALLDHLGLARAAILGVSRGGLLGMVLAATAPRRVSGLCLIDVGPALERKGLERIGSYIGVRPQVGSLDEIADRLPAAMPGFRHVPPFRWAEEAVRHYVETDHGIDLPYDPALRQAFDAAMAAPAVDMWPLFDACADTPLALVRAAGSDVLSAATADEMQRRRPDMIRAEVPDRGHVPFLDEPESLAAIRAWLAALDSAGDQAGDGNAERAG
ncbi:alpha/beta fold hydrolase [Phaeovulum vinaykumarii]|uniref:Pimeloyl-ACP methyl ester carboxylesterase n=1 Tax=Phaeovulum vinaykumarii TaxID=407234 RepID=A0A1N7K0J2_9RHOB|nr:alpha/beta hydrolase [Phaeovulum vinaykumarii]SIS55100.1 Pimeloyl-ACP methyl ester carboxylesterase [Phaeovulum vinaykumarii]SOB92224.1 pimeloyl-ACP methyl ester carboxylesterase [Phaeovulum vinaykumarii]